MAESLKEARRDAASDWDVVEDAIRVLQRQAFVEGAIWARTGMGYRDADRERRVVESYRHAIDALLDGPAPEGPVARVVAVTPRTKHLAAGFVMQLPADDDGPAPEGE